MSVNTNVWQWVGVMCGGFVAGYLFINGALWRRICPGVP